MVWLANKLVNVPMNRGNFEFADVTASGEKIVVNGSTEIREVSLCSGYGYSYVPPKGERVMIMDCNDKIVCVGAANNTRGLMEGEIRILNCVGAEILLKSNGDITLNGVTVTKDGIIKAKEFIVQG